MSTEYVRSLPDRKSVQLAQNATATITIDGRLDCQAVRFDVRCNVPLSLRTSAGGLITLVQPGVSVQNFPQGVYSVQLTNDGSGANNAQVIMDFYDEPQESTPDVIPVSAALTRAIAFATLAAPDSASTGTIISAAALGNGSKRYRMLGHKLEAGYFALGGAAVGSHAFRVALQSNNGNSNHDVMEDVIRTPTGQAFTANMVGPWIPYPEPGYIFPAGHDLRLYVEELTVAGTAANIRIQAVAWVLGVIEDVAV